MRTMTAQPDNPRPQRGSAVHHYLLGEPLGEGATAWVFSAWDRRHGRSVALKLPRNRGAQALQAEAQALAAVDDPRVVRLLDFGPWRDRAYLAMERLEGRSLRAWLADGPQRDEVLRVLAELGRAIEQVHRAGLVHGDLKPHNVLVTATGEVRLLDFGLASTPARARPCAGTPAYLAPEVFDSRPASAASDQFAFAVVAYEALVGRRPFAGRNWVMQVLDPRPPCWEAIPKPLRAVLGRALCPQPEGRSTPAALIDALEAAR